MPLPLAPGVFFGSQSVERRRPPRVARPRHDTAERPLLHLMPVSSELTRDPSVPTANAYATPPAMPCAMWSTDRVNVPIVSKGRAVPIFLTSHHIAHLRLEQLPPSFFSYMGLAARNIDGDSMLMLPGRQAPSRLVGAATGFPARAMSTIGSGMWHRSFH